MNNFHISVELDPRTGDDEQEVKIIALLAEHGWHVFPMSPVSDRSNGNNRLRIHRELPLSYPTGTATKYFDELRSLDIDAEISNGWIHSPVPTERNLNSDYPLLPLGDSYTYELTTSGHTSAELDREIERIPTPPGSGGDATRHGRTGAEQSYNPGIFGESLNDRVLFDYVDDKTTTTTKSDLAASILRARYGLQTDKAIEKLLSNQDKAVDLRVKTANEHIASLKEWRRLAELAPRFITLTLVIAVAILVGGFLLAKWGRLDGYQFSIVIVMSAVFVASPATLLLLERPLRGVDAAGTGKLAISHSDTE